MHVVDENRLREDVREKLAPIEQMFDAMCGVSTLFGFPLSDTETTFGRNILHITECKPDGSRWHAGLDGLLGCQPPDRAEHQVMREHAAIGFAEFIGDRQPELAQTHDSKLTVKCRMPRPVF